MKVNQIKVGVILSYTQMAIQIMVGLIYTPIMLKLLGQSEYGLYNTVASTISTLGILSLGFGSSYIRYYAKYKKNNEVSQIYKLNGLFIIVFGIIGFIAALCGGFLTFHLELVFDKGLTSAELEIARVLMVLLTFNLAASFPMSVFGTIIGAHEKFIFQKALGMIQTVLSPCLTLPMLMLGFGSIGLVSVSVGLSIVTWIYQIYYCFAKLKERFIFKNLDVSVFKGALIYSGFIAINMIVDQINCNIDKILLGRYKGTVAVAIYSIGFSLYTYYQTFSTSVSNVFTPRIHTIVNNTEKDMKIQKKLLTELFVKVGRIQFLILGCIASGMCFFGKDFITCLWAGKGYEDSYAVALLLILPSSIALIQNTGIEIQRALNKHQFRSIVYLGMAIINLGLSIVLCQKYGAIGSAIGTAVSFLVANGIIMNIFYHQACNIDIIKFWKSIGKISKGLIVPCILGVIIKCYGKYINFTVFALEIVLYCVIYALSMWKFGMNEYEKNLTKGAILKLVKKGK